MTGGGILNLIDSTQLSFISRGLLFCLPASSLSSSLDMLEHSLLVKSNRDKECDSKEARKKDRKGMFNTCPL